MYIFIYFFTTKILHFTTKNSSLLPSFFFIFIDFYFINTLGRWKKFFFFLFISFQTFLFLLFFFEIRHAKFLLLFYIGSIYYFVVFLKGIVLVIWNCFRHYEKLLWFFGKVFFKKIFIKIFKNYCREIFWKNIFFRSEK